MIAERYKICVLKNRTLLSRYGHENHQH